jgi:hypothetical protein
MEYGQIKTKEVREFLRASDLLLGLMRNANDGYCTDYEVLLIKTYLESLKSTILKMESAEVIKAVRIDQAQRSDGNADHPGRPPART